MTKLADHVHNLARNQHGGIMGYVRKADGLLDGPRPLDLFVLNGRLTCPEIEKLREPDAVADRELGFRGEVVELNGAIKRALRCGDMLIGLND